MHAVVLDPSIPSDIQVLLELLRSFGYEPKFRENGWTECLVAGHDETWQGCGVNQDAALQDTLRRMLPSSLARAGLLQLLPRRSSQESIAEMVSGGREATEEPVSFEPSPSVATLAITLVDAVQPEPTPQLPTIQLPESVGFEAVLVAPTPPPKPATRTPAVGDRIPLERIARPAPLYSIDEAEERILEILTAIDNETSDIGMMSCLHQRLHIASWIFRARGMQEVWPAQAKIAALVHEVASKLGDLCKVFWPGTIKALQLATRPEQALEGFNIGPVARTWLDAADRIEKRLDQALHSGDDEWGWADKIKCLPPDPDAVLDEAVTKIESVIGSLEVPADERRKRLATNVMLDGMEDLVLAAHLLRWVRVSEVDGLRWGKAMGALRWVEHMLYLGRSHPLSEVMDESYVPQSDWADLLGRNPEANQQRARVESVVSGVPAAGAPRAVLCAWLMEAFAVLANPQIAKIADHLKLECLELTNEDFTGADRSVRSRLRKLQEIFRRGMDTSSVTLPEMTTSTSILTESGGESAAELLLARVRPHLEGKRILFVSNREDDELSSRLERDLRCFVMVRDGGTVRKAQIVASAVTPGAFDMILVATSFVSHELDSMMSKLSKQLGIPYIRANKGRPVATIRALARHFVEAAS